MADRHEVSSVDIWDLTSNWMQNLLAFLSVNDLKALVRVDEKRQAERTAFLGGKIIAQQDRVQWILLSAPTQPNLKTVESWNALQKQSPHIIASNDYNDHQGSIRKVSNMKPVFASLVSWIAKFEVDIHDWNNQHLGKPFTRLVQVIEKETRSRKQAVEKMLNELNKFKPALFSSSKREREKDLIIKAKGVWKALAKRDWFNP